MSGPTRVENALGFVREHPEMFLPGSRRNPLACIQHLVVEVLALGGSDVQVRRLDGWWVLWSTFDWFGGLDVHEAFSRIVPVPAVGANASRVEIVLAAFADSVATYGVSSGRLVVQGEGPSERVWQEMIKGSRAVAFRFPVPSATP